MRMQFTIIFLIVIGLTTVTCFEDFIPKQDQFIQIFPPTSTMIESDHHTFGNIHHWRFPNNRITLYRRAELQGLNQHWQFLQTAAKMEFSEEQIPQSSQSFLRLHRLSDGNYLFCLQWSHITNGQPFTRDPTDILMIRKGANSRRLEVFIEANRETFVEGEPIERVHRTMKLMHISTLQKHYFFGFSVRNPENGILLGNLKLLKVSIALKDNWSFNSHFEYPTVPPTEQSHTYVQTVDFWISRTMNLYPFGLVHQACLLSLEQQNSILQPICTIQGYYRVKVCWRPQIFEEQIDQTIAVVVNGNIMQQVQVTNQLIQRLHTQGKYCKRQQNTFYTQGYVMLGDHRVHDYVINTVEVKTTQHVTGRLFITKLEVKSKHSLEYEKEAEKSRQAQGGKGSSSGDQDYPQTPRLKRQIQRQKKLKSNIV